MSKSSSKCYRCGVYKGFSERIIMSKMIPVLKMNTRQIKLIEDKPLDLNFKVKKFTLTERIQIQTTPQLRYLFQRSKELWNTANLLKFRGAHEFVLWKGRTTQKAGKHIFYEAINRELKDEEVYRALTSQTSQQILRLLDRCWKGFFETIADWKVNPEKYRGRPQPPGLKEEYDQFLLIFTNQQCRIKSVWIENRRTGKLEQKGQLIFPRKLNIDPILVNPKRIDRRLQQVRVLPRGHFSIVEIVYKKEVGVPKLDRKRKSRIIALDLGVRNIIAIVSNCLSRPVVVKGGTVKAVNQFYNKKRAHYLKVYKEKGVIGRGIKGQTRRLERLDRKRNNKIEDLFHKLSSALLKFCLINKIGRIIIGYNERWKEGSQMGDRNNQNFVNIPYYRLVQKIKYKADLEGIIITLQEESHTSKCSFLDSEPIEHHEQYCGQRGVYRSRKEGGAGKVSHGLFKSKQGIIINSDVNGALNILRKAVPNAFADGIEGLGLVPISVTFTELKKLANLNLTKQAVPKAQIADGIEVRGVVASENSGRSDHRAAQPMSWRPRDPHVDDLASSEM